MLIKNVIRDTGNKNTWHIIDNGHWEQLLKCPKSKGSTKERKINNYRYFIKK
jgi:hypothetical protein